MGAVSCWTQPKEESELIQGMFFLVGFSELPNLLMDCHVLITLVYVLQNGVLATDDKNIESKLLSLWWKKYQAKYLSFP